MNGMPADPRPVFAEATAWVAALLRATKTEQLADPTPCTDFDVAALGSHLIGTVRRAVAIGEGADPLSVDLSQTAFDAERYAQTAQRAIELWADDTKLGAMVKVPWGTVPGAAALWGYVNEQFTHGWDLAQATGQDSEADPASVEQALGFCRAYIPADREGAPFGAVVEPRADAGPTEQLANWLGRSADWR